MRPGEPGYDPRTLFIPKKAWVDFTPFEKQVGHFHECVAYTSDHNFLLVLGGMILEYSCLYML